MYNRNSKYFPSQQVPQNAQISSSFLQQQLPQGYTMPTSMLSQLQQQQVPIQHGMRYPANSNAINVLRGQSKLPSTQVDTLRLQSVPSQSTSWLLNGSLPLHHQANQEWQTRSKNQSNLHSEQVNFNLTHSSQDKNIVSSMNMPQAAMKMYGFRSDGRSQSHLPQASSTSQGLQQSQSSRITPQNLTQHLGSTAAIPSHMQSLQPEQLSQLQQRHLLNQSLSHPPSNTMQSSNLLHSPPSRSSLDLGLNLLQGHSTHQSMQHPLQSGSSKTVTTQPEKRDKIHIRFSQKKQNQPNVPLPQKLITKQSDEDEGRDEPQLKAKSPLILENNVRIVIDDDIEIVGAKEAEIMSHIRSDCPIHPYERVERVDLPPTISNMKCCSKCFCYICDKLAGQCDKWKDAFSPHCNANTKSSCWKARRNIKKSPLITMLTSEELTHEITLAGETAIKYIIQVREAYITYRNGIPCEFHLVPCECACHRSSKFSKDPCAQCKAVHDMKKKFNYEPVRAVVLEIIGEIQKEHNKPYKALVLYEALLSELCSHRPADFNHVTRMPSNPDARCQCNTPQIMEEHVEWDLIKLFVMNDVNTSIKEKFLKCVKASVLPLQLKDILKKFLEMRHWDDLSLQDVLRGHKTPGSSKPLALKEEALIIEMRVKKLAQEEKFLEIVRYLELVKNSKPSKNTISDGTSLSSAMDKWILESLVKTGHFRDACMKLVNAFRALPVNYILSIFSLLAGKGLPPNTKLVSSFNHTHPTRYEVIGIDRTVLLLLFLMFMEVKETAQTDFSCYLWLAKWLNQEKLEHNQNETSKWMQNSSEFLEWSRQVSTLSFSQHMQHCRPIIPQAALFTCSRLIIQYMNKLPGNMSYILDVIDAYKNNEWALFYMFSQPALLGCGNHHLITWLTSFLKSTSSSLSQLSPEAFGLLIKSHAFMDVCLFMRQWVSPVWVTRHSTFLQYFLEVCSLFAQRVMEEVSNANYLKASEWLRTVVFEKIVERHVERDPNLLPYCEAIGRVCCYIEIDTISLYKKMLHRDSPVLGPNILECYRNSISEIFTFHQQRFQKNLLNPEETGALLRYSIHEGNIMALKLIFNYYMDKHECPDPGSTAVAIMNEITDVLKQPTDNWPIKKDDLMNMYSRLLSHDTLSWLICAKCSAKMPDKWMEVWKLLAKNGMFNLLYNIVELTLHQFTLWMKELCVQEKADIERLLRCLNVFIANVADSLVSHCSFELDKLKKSILQTANHVANPQLQRDYLIIIQSVFETLRKQRLPSGEAIEQKSHAPDPPSATTSSPMSLSRSSIPRNIPTSPEPSRQRTNTDHLEAHKAIDEKTIAREQPKTKPINHERAHAEHAPASRPIKRTAPAATLPTAPIANEKQSQEAVNQQAPLKLTISKSRLSSSSEASSPAPDKRASSPSVNSTTSTGSCPQCGDPMTSLFRCSKCSTRKSIAVRCPKCNQVNRDLKGYNCKFCYFSLLEVLTSKDATKQDEKDPVEKHDSVKKRKKLKRKKTETSVKILNPIRNEAAALPKYPDEVERRTSMNSSEDGEGGESKRPRFKNLSLKSKDRSGAKLNLSSNEVVTAHRSSESTNSAAPSSFAPKSHHRAVISKISVADLTPQPPKPHQRAKEAQQKERPHSRPPPPTQKHDRNVFSSMKSSEPSLSESDTDEEEVSSHQVPPLLLRRKSELEATPEKKALESEPVQAPPTKRPVNQGSLMSKKQKTILNRMKQVGRSKSFVKQPKNSSKSQSGAGSEWEVSKRRKPGPKSKTSYYSVNAGWDIPRPNSDAR